MARIPSSSVVDDTTGWRVTASWCTGEPRRMLQLLTSNHFVGEISQGSGDPPNPCNTNKLRWWVFQDALMLEARLPVSRPFGEVLKLSNMQTDIVIAVTKVGDTFHVSIGSLFSCSMFLHSCQPAKCRGIAFCVGLKLFHFTARVGEQEKAGRPWVLSDHFWVRFWGLQGGVDGGFQAPRAFW